MLPQFVRSVSGPIQLLVGSTKKVNQLPGGTTYVAKEKQISIEVQQYQHPLFSIGYRFLKFFKNLRLRFQEVGEGVRLEAVLSGELPVVNADGKVVSIQSGQYRLSDNPDFITLFKKDTACRYFITHYSRNLLESTGVSKLVTKGTIKNLSADMRRTIQKILDNPFKDQLLDFHHHNCIRELLLLHLTNKENNLPGELKESDLAAIYRADAILQEDLSRHDEIPLLAKKAGIGVKQLKKGFRKVFQMGVFERLTWHRMEHSKLLLRTTYKTVDDIADLSGYGSRNSFITAFKRNFALTPGQWRKQEL